MATNNFLMDGEEVKFRTKPSMGRPVGGTMVLVPLAAACAMSSHYWFAVGFVLMTIGLWAQYGETEIVVTNKRLIAKTGMSQQSSLDMFLAKVESVTYKNTFNEKDTVVIVGSGGTREVLQNIRKAKELSRQIQVQVGALQASK